MLECQLCYSSYVYIIAEIILNKITVFERSKLSRINKFICVFAYPPMHVTQNIQFLVERLGDIILYSNQRIFVFKTNFFLYKFQDISWKTIIRLTVATYLQKCIYFILFFRIFRSSIHTWLGWMHFQNFGNPLFNRSVVWFDMKDMQPMTFFTGNSNFLMKLK